MVTPETFLLMAAIYTAPNLPSSVRIFFAGVCLLISMLMWTFRPV